MRELRSLVDEYEARVLIGESDRVAFLGEGDDCLHTVFNFPLMNMGQLTPVVVRDNIAQRWAMIPAGGWLANTLGNHDRPRSLQAHSDGIHDQELARVSLALLLTLPGTPFLYYGEEIGMTNLYLEDLGLVRDRVSLWVYQAALERGVPPHIALHDAVRHGRDRCRTPMQWSAGPNAGFSPAGVQTWLPVNPDYARGVNVETQDGDPGSLLRDYRRLIHLRRDTPALKSGVYQAIHASATEYLAYLRRLEGRGTCTVVINFSDKAHHPDFSSIAPAAVCLFSTHKPQGSTHDLARLPLAPFEVFIGEFFAQP